MHPHCLCLNCICVSMFFFHSLLALSQKSSFLDYFNIGMFNAPPLIFLRLLGWCLRSFSIWLLYSHSLPSSPHPSPTKLKKQIMMLHCCFLCPPQEIANSLVKEIQHRHSCKNFHMRIVREDAPLISKMIITHIRQRNVQMLH